MLGISFLVLLFIDILSNIVINTNSMGFVVLIDIISFFSIVWFGISRWMIYSIERLIHTVVNED